VKRGAITAARRGLAALSLRVEAAEPKHQWLIVHARNLFCKVSILALWHKS